MRIGLAFTSKEGSGANSSRSPMSSTTLHVHGSPDGAPDDAEEEFDSLETIQALAATIESLGHEVELLGDGEEAIGRLVAGYRPDLVFNIAEGRGAGRCREARLPAALEIFGIPYTGSDPLTLSTTLDKDCAKKLVQAAGVATPRWILVTHDDSATRDRLAQFEPPVIVKPAFEGSSKGIRGTSLVRTREQMWPTVQSRLTDYRQPILVEEFIDGDELTVGMVGNPGEVIGIMRVLPKSSGPFVYSLEVKRDWENQVRYECPAKLSEADTQAVRETALASWSALGCRDVSRVDIRLRDHVPYFLEVNPLPGLSPISGDLVILSRFMGISHPELIAKIIDAAATRVGLGAATSVQA